jgi:hypothetical protein
MSHIDAATNPAWNLSFVAKNIRTITPLRVPDSEKRQGETWKVTCCDSWLDEWETD